MPHCLPYDYEDALTDIRLMVQGSREVNSAWHAFKIVRFGNWWPLAKVCALNGKLLLRVVRARYWLLHFSYFAIKQTYTCHKKSKYSTAAVKFPKYSCPLFILSKLCKNVCDAT